MSGDWRVVRRPSDLRAGVVIGLGIEGAGKNEPGISRCRAIPLRQAGICCRSPPVLERPRVEQALHA